MGKLVTKGGKLLVKGGKLVVVADDGDPCRCCDPECTNCLSAAEVIAITLSGIDTSYNDVTAVFESGQPYPGGGCEVGGSPCIFPHSMTVNVDESINSTRFCLRKVGDCHWRAIVPGLCSVTLNGSLSSPPTDARSVTDTGLVLDVKWFPFAAGIFPDPGVPARFEVNITVGATSFISRTTDDGIGCFQIFFGRRFFNDVSSPAFTVPTALNFYRGGDNAPSTENACASTRTFTQCFTNPETGDFPGWCRGCEGDSAGHPGPVIVGDGGTATVDFNPTETCSDAGYDSEPQTCADVPGSQPDAPDTLVIHIESCPEDESIIGDYPIFQVGNTPVWTDEDTGFAIRCTGSFWEMNLGDFGKFFAAVNGPTPPDGGWVLCSSGFCLSESVSVSEGP